MVGANTEIRIFMAYILLSLFIGIIFIIGELIIGYTDLYLPEYTRSEFQIAVTLICLLVAITNNIYSHRSMMPMWNTITTDISNIVSFDRHTNKVTIDNNGNII